MEETPKSTPSGCVVVFAMAVRVGIPAFLLGLIGPLILDPEANLGPLLGIFVTGPLGCLVGALGGIIISARNKSPRPIRGEFWWLACAWGFAEFYSLTLGQMLPRWLSLTPQLSVSACGAFLLCSKSVRLPGWARHGRSFMLLGAWLVILTSIFPPLAPPSPDGSRFAFFLDQRFDASKHVPDFTVNAGMLLIERLIIVVSVAIVGLASSFRNRSEPS